jgi:hypothetical protein
VICTYIASCNVVVSITYTHPYHKKKEGGGEKKGEGKLITSTSTISGHGGAMKNPSGEKVFCSLANFLFLRADAPTFIPPIDGFAFVKGLSREPGVVFGFVAFPLNEELPTVLTAVGVGDLVHSVFF